MIIRSSSAPKWPRQNWWITLSANSDLVMESKARWDKGGKELYNQKVVGTGPFEFVERKVSSHVLYKRVENHWRKTPEMKELEFRWVPEGVTRLATLIAGRSAYL